MKPLVVAAIAAGGTATLAGVRMSLWQRATARAVARLAAQQRNSIELRSFDSGRLANVPDCVARYFRYALTPGRPLVVSARFEQSGSMRTGRDGDWAPFGAIEHFSVEPPGFVWEAAMRVAPGLDIRIRDQYLDGAGSSQASIAGVFPLGGLSGTPEAAAASLVRYLAEAAWLPSALLPSEHMQWTGIDDRNARVTLTDGQSTVSLNVSFGPSNEIARVSTLRYRDVQGVPVLTPWAGSFYRYAAYDGMMIPLAAEVVWTLSDGPLTVWRGNVTSVSHTCGSTEAALTAPH